MALKALLTQPSSEVFIVAFNHVVQAKGYAYPLTREQEVECAFGAGYSVGVNQAKAELKESIEHVLDQADGFL